MAKTKKQQQQSHVDNKAQTETTTEAAQIENLKNLNKFLLTETKDRRKQVEALVLSKGSLETERDGLIREKEAVEREMDVFLREKEVVEGERDVLMKEKEAVQRKVESVEREKEAIERERDGFRREKEVVERERDGLRREKEVVERKVEGFKREEDEVEKKIQGFEREVAELKGELVGKADEIVILRSRLGEMVDREDVIIKEKGCLKRSLEDEKRVVEKLKREIEKMRREMEALENDVVKMNELLLSLRGEEKVLRDGIAEIERREKERREEFERKTREIDGLVRANEEMERKFWGLVEEKGEVENSLKCSVKEINEVSRKLSEVNTEKVVIEAAKKGVEGEIVWLNGETNALRAAIEVLEAESKGESEKNKKLNVAINLSREEIVRVTSEKDDARKVLEAEREIRFSLLKKVSEMEKKTKETEMLLAKIKMENQSIGEEKSGLVGDYNALEKVVASLEGSRLNDKKDINNLSADLLKKDANLGYVLKIVKEVRVGGLGIDEGGDLGEEIRPVVDELVGIWKEMREAEAKLKETREQVDLLNKAVEAHKKKSFWAVVSSATTVFAAASVASAAYIARAH